MMIARLGHGLASFAKDRGLDIAPLIAAVGLPADAFDAPDRRIETVRFARLLEMLAVNSGDDCFGLAFGANLQLGNSGNLGLALLNSPTLRQAVECCERYAALLSDDAYFEGQQVNGDLIATWKCAPELLDAAQLADFRAMLLIRTFRRYLGTSWKPASVTLVRKPPRALQQHQALLADHVQFLGPTTQMILSMPDMDARCESGDERVRASLLQACENELRSVQRMSSLTMQVFDLIQKRLGTGSATLRDVASDLAMGERTLQRRLVEVKSSFDLLLETARRQLADRLLRDANLTIAEVSDACGYASPSSFSRAIKSWFGQTAAEYRTVLLSRNMQTNQTQQAQLLSD